MHFVIVYKFAEKKLLKTEKLNTTIDSDMT